MKAATLGMWEVTNLMSPALRLLDVLMEDTPIPSASASVFSPPCHHL